MRKDHYPPLLEMLQTISQAFMTTHSLILPPKNPIPTWAYFSKFCLYHRQSGNTIKDSYQLKDLVYDFVEKNTID